MWLRIIFIAAFGLLFVSFGSFQKKQEEDYAEIFSTDYQKALRFLKSEKRIDSVIRFHGLNTRGVIAIAFPELIRYNSIQDKIETFALETLYVQYGKAYANFSVGEFQIKPSFAESIERDFLKKSDGKVLWSNFQIKSGDTIQNQENRKARLKRIKSKTGMVNYLCLFWDVMTRQYPNWKNDEEKIKFFATAYNYDFEKPRQEIERAQGKKFFHTGLAATSTKYNYGNIAWYFYRQP